MFLMSNQALSAASIQNSAHVENFGRRNNWSAADKVSKKTKRCCTVCRPFSLVKKDRADKNKVAEKGTGTWGLMNIWIVP